MDLLVLSSKFIENRVNFIFNTGVNDFQFGLVLFFVLIKFLLVAQTSFLDLFKRTIVIACEVKSDKSMKLYSKCFFIPILFDRKLRGFCCELIHNLIKRYFRMTGVFTYVSFPFKMGSDDEFIVFNFKIKGNIILFFNLSTIISWPRGSTLPAKAFLGIGNPWRRCLKLNLVLMFLVFTHFLLFSTFFHAAFIGHFGTSYRQIFWYYL